MVSAFMKLKKNPDLKRETYNVTDRGELVGAVWLTDSGWWRHAYGFGWRTAREAANSLVRIGRAKS